MACTSCSTSDGVAPKGCKIMGLAAPIATINSFDWLSNMSLPNGWKLLLIVLSAFKTDEEFYR
jgi:hypothetical protein